MKKKITYTLLSILGLFFAILLAIPFFIESEKIQQEIIQRIEACYLVDASVEDVKLSFYPLPQLKLLNIEVVDQQFKISVPEVNIYPSWRLLLGEPKVGHITLKQPQIYILKNPFHPKNPQPNQVPFTLPEYIPDVSISISDGFLEFPDMRNEWGQLNKIATSGIEASFTLKNKNISLNWQSHSLLGEAFNITALISLKDFTSKGTFLSKNMDLATLFKPSAGSPFALISDTSDIAATFTYSKKSGLTLDFKGDIPNFSITDRTNGTETIVPILIGNADLQIRLNKGNFKCTIASLQLIDPAAQLQGVVSYYLPENGHEKHVLLDLQGKDIDVTTLRHKLLLVVGDNMVTKIVSEIVLNGTAKSASYYFDNTIAGFEDIRNMTINVDVARTDIHLKYVPLDLHNATGKIRIKDGDLSGWNITAEVGDSKGINGSFLVGLGHDNWGLIVDVDIDANLAQLPPLLWEVIPVDTIVEELHLLEMSGRADGHLHIGEDLRHFNIAVDVHRFKGSEIRYDRLSWPILPSSGALRITDTGASWQDLSLHIGNHTIHTMSGNIDWVDNAIPFELSSINATLDNNTILSELRHHDSLTEKIDSFVQSLVGSTALKGKINGNLFSPSTYQYDFRAEIVDMGVQIVYFPEKIVVNSAQVKVTDQSIDIETVTGIVLGDSLKVTGTFTHDHWLDWAGDLSFDGEIRAPLVAWLIKKDILPDKLEIQTPAEITDMTVQWQDKLFSIQGDLQPNDTETKLKLQITVARDVVTGDFIISHGQDQAEVRYFFEPEYHKYDIALSGTLPGRAVDNLLVDPFIRFEQLNGTMMFHATLPSEQTAPNFIFTGDLNLDKLNLLINKDVNSDHTIDIALSGKQQLLEIKHFDINYGNAALLAHGQFQHNGWNGLLSLNISSPEVNTDTVDEIVKDLETFFYVRLGLPKNQELKSEKYFLQTDIQFDFDNFVVPFGLKKDKQEDNKEYQFPIKPLRGQYSVNSSNSSLKINDSNVCGLELEAFLTWFGDKETSKDISVQTPAGTTVELRDFLECFNSNSVIEGPMTFKANANSKKGSIKSATFKWTSEKGHIYKFAALAKAISILNIKGWSGSIWEKGYYYNQLEVSGTIDNNILKISKLFIDGDGVDIVGKGTFDLDTVEYDMVFYVVPFASMNRVVNNVPIVGRLLGGKEGRIISVPVKITGPAIDPNVSVMNVSEIGNATGKWIWDTVTIPFNWSNSVEIEDVDVDENETFREKEAGN